ncbi:molybdenum cofactor guanylyltransferase [Aliiglaciecola litoralis]|uniref:Molybdenum cofactor guanylyltransferase n=1 Tax=Aliiglaciecola litoralis TaxID=582857 RepID=A0ABN1LR50_9ALTE
MSIIGVVLSGGASRRMGTDKALLEIAQQSMLERAVQVLKQTTVTKVEISRNGRNKDYISDILPNKGPLSGIHSVAMRFPYSDLIVLPVDLPLISVSAIQSLIDTGMTECRNVRFANHNLPLYVHNSARFRQAIDYTLRCTQSFSVERLCEHFPLTEIAVTEPSQLLNTNTPEQWHSALQLIPHNQVNLINQGSHESFR